jgi:hypothetical protein
MSELRLIRPYAEVADGSTSARTRAASPNRINGDPCAGIIAGSPANASSTVRATACFSEQSNDK